MSASREEMKQNEKNKVDMYHKEVSKPQDAVVTLMREEKVKFNRSISMRADCAILILNSQSSEAESQEQL